MKEHLELKNIAVPQQRTVRKTPPARAEIVQRFQRKGH
jgi:hypothetical protein